MIEALIVALLAGCSGWCFGYVYGAEKARKYEKVTIPDTDDGVV